jgi:phosphoribosylanthranilate isomerase
MVDLALLPHFVKICGVTSVEDAQGIHARGASAIGLILASSKRRISIGRATEIATATKGDLLRVAVFRDNSDDFICEAVDATGVDIVQVHGVLTDELLGLLRSRGVAVLKALSLGNEEFYDFDETKVDAVLVDGPTPGSGDAHSWVEVQARRFGVPIVAAGGLTPSNVESVISSVHPWGVDVSTGVESSPGVKDLALVGSFVDLAHHAFSQREE